MSEKVIRRGNETVRVMMQKLKKLMQQSGKFWELRRRESYMKPSEIRRRRVGRRKAILRDSKE